MPYTCKELFDKGYRLDLPKIEKQLMKKNNEELFVKDCDFCYVSCKNGKEWVFIKKNDKLCFYAAMMLHGRYLSYNINVPLCKSNEIMTFRKATAEERELLKSVLKNNNLYWDEKKFLDNIIPYKKYDSLLVRRDTLDYWRLAILKNSGRDDKGLFYTNMDNFTFRHSLPLNDDTIQLKDSYSSYRTEE